MYCFAAAEPPKSCEEEGDKSAFILDVEVGLMRKIWSMDGHASGIPIPSEGSGLKDILVPCKAFF